MRCLWFSLCVVAAFVSLPQLLCARHRSVGATIGYSGISVAYTHESMKDAVWDISLKAAMGEVFAGRGRIPGAEFSFVHNICFAEKESARAGCVMRFYAGPGVSVGYLPDFRRNHGIMAGLAADLGMELDFAGEVSVCLYLEPVLGIHSARSGGGVRNALYINGLMQTVMPNISVRYVFK